MLKKIIISTVIIPVCCLIVLLCGKSSVGPPASYHDWETATPESEGMNSVLLDDLTNRIQMGSYGMISSLLIVRNNKIVYEEYFNGMENSDLHNIYSVTKSVTSALIGIALREGKINSVYEQVYPFFPEYTVYDNWSINKDSITIEHLLQMRSGFFWEEIRIPYGDPQNSFTQMYSSSDLVKFTLDRPLEDRPGSTFVYNTGGSMVLGGILRNVYGYSVEELAQRVLFTPLGIDRYDWVQRHNGFIPTGTGLKLIPRDMAKFGQLYLQHGIWDGDTLIPPEWIERSNEPYTYFSDSSGYGYHWWLEDVIIDGQKQLIPEAMGWGNQHIFVIDDLNMVVVSTGENGNNFTYFIYDILNQYIIPSII